MQIVVGSSNIVVMALGRWVLPGNSMTHTLEIFDGNSNAVSGGSTTVNTAGKSAGAFTYANLASPVTLSAGATYYIVSAETTGGDNFYNGDCTVTSTSVATVTGAVLTGPGSGPPGGVFWSGQHTLGPVDFVYSIGGGGGSQVISSISLRNSTFTGGTGSANSVIGTATASMNPASPPFSGSWSLSGADASKFAINSSTGVLSVGPSDVADGTYNINIVATGVSYSNSPFSAPEALTGSSGGASITPSQSLIRPATVEFPLSVSTVTVANGPGNARDYVAIAVAGSPDGSGFINKVYLNGSTIPPSTGVPLPATVNIAAPDGFYWDNNGYSAPILSWEVRYYLNDTGTVLARAPVTVDILKRVELFQAISTPGFDSYTTITYPIIQVSDGTPVRTVSGSISIALNFTNPPPIPAVINYTVDDVFVGSPISGTPGFTSFASTLDTTVLADGTHCLGMKVIDCVGGTFAARTLPYMWQCVQTLFIVNNHGVVSGSQRVPTTDSGSGPSARLNSGAADFVTYPGTAAALANTPAPMPVPQSGLIRGANDPLSIYHSNPALLRLNSNWYVDSLAGAESLEYFPDARFFTKKTGGVYIIQDAAEDGASIEEGYRNITLHGNFDGLRNDNRTDPYIVAVNAPDGLSWHCCEVFGRIIKLDFTGAVTTLAGGTVDRTKLQYYKGDTTITDDDNNAVQTLVGTIGTPGFGDMRGSDDLCYDPNNSNHLYVANPISHIIHLVDFSTNPPTLTRYAGQENGLGNIAAAPGTGGGFADGPATEYTAGQATVATCSLGTISGTTFTQGGTVTGTFALGCPLTGSGVTAGTLIVSGTGPSWTVNNSQSAGPTAITATTPVALFNEPYSLDIIGTTMYISDFRNARIRTINMTTGAVGTLIGNQTNLVPFSDIGAGTGLAGPIGTFNVSSMTYNSTTKTASVLLSSPISGTVPVTVAPGWTLIISGAVNPGPGGDSYVNGPFIVNGVTNNGQFTLAMTDTDSNTTTPQYPNGGAIGSGTAIAINGTITLQAWYMDVYAPSTRLPEGTIPFSSAYAVAPFTLRKSSDGNLLWVSTWSGNVYKLDLSANQMIYQGTNFSTNPPGTRINALFPGGQGQRTFLPETQNGWYWMDCDTNGTCGPVDDVILARVGAISGNFYRFSLDGTFAEDFGSQGSIDTGLIPEGGYWTGHYPWAVTFSDTQARILTTGMSDGSIHSARAYDPSYDILPTTLNTDYPSSLRGFIDYLQGSIQASFWTTVPGIFPWGVRPGMAQIRGPHGLDHLGLSNTQPFDALMATYPDDASLGAYIQGGFGGTLPRPEFTGDDLTDMIYWIRRSSMPGSGVGTGALVNRTPFTTDVTPPLVTSLTCTRQSNTSIRVQWTTSKPTYGCVCAGSPNEVNSVLPYHIFAMEPYLGQPVTNSYNLSHDVTITHLPDVTSPTSPITYIAVIAKDLAGNNTTQGDAQYPGTIYTAGPRAVGAAGAYNSDGDTADPSTGASLKTGWGTWTWGQQMLAPGTHSSVGWYWLMLNGKVVAFSGVLTQDFGGNVFDNGYDGNRYVFNAYSFQINNSPNYTNPVLPAPPIVTGPFTPSADDSSIAAPNGTLKTADGVWTWGAQYQSTANYYLVLNGVQINAAGTQMQVNSKGQLWWLSQTGAWYVFLNYTPLSTSLGGPPSGPIPLGIFMTPARVTISHTATAGTLVANVAVPTSDGSPFAGTVVVQTATVTTVNVLALAGSAPNFSLVLSRDLNAADIGSDQEYTILPTQNGVQNISGATYFIMDIT